MDQPDISSSAPMSGSEGLLRVVDALRRFESDMSERWEAEKARAAEARRASAEASDELRLLREELEEMRERAERLEADRHAARNAMARMADALRTYVAETDKAQQALLALSRHALGLDSLPDPRETQMDDQRAQAQFEGATTIASTNARSWPAPSDPPSDSMSMTDDIPFDEDSSNEHRLIDLQNRLDMRRLDLMSRLSSTRSLARHRTS